MTRLVQLLADAAIRVLFAIDQRLAAFDTRLCSRTANNPDAEADL